MPGISGGVRTGEVDREREEVCFRCDFDFFFFLFSFFSVFDFLDLRFGEGERVLERETSGVTDKDALGFIDELGTQHVHICRLYEYSQTCSASSRWITHVVRCRSILELARRLLTRVLVCTGYILGSKHTSQ